MEKYSPSPSDKESWRCADSWVNKLSKEASTPWPHLYVRFLEELIEAEYKRSYQEWDWKVWWGSGAEEMPVEADKTSLDRKSTFKNSTVLDLRYY